MNPWIAVASLLLAAGIACGGGGGSSAPVLLAPTIIGTSTTPPLADWVPGQPISLNWALGGGAPSNESLTVGSTESGLWASGQGAPPTSYSFTPVFPAGAYGASGAITVNLYVMNSANWTVAGPPYPAQASWILPAPPDPRIPTTLTATANPAYRNPSTGTTGMALILTLTPTTAAGTVGIISLVPIGAWNTETTVNEANGTLPLWIPLSAGSSIQVSYPGDSVYQPSSSTCVVPTP